MSTVEHLAPPAGLALATALARPEAYSERPAAVEVRETHISWVFLAGDRAYKLKKPVKLPSVHYGTPARRRAMCEEEVRLNRRLAPDMYLGTRAVVATAAGEVALAPAGDPDAIDYVVEMRRFDEARTLAALVSHGGVSRRELEAVGRRLAEFHAAAALPDTGGVTAALHAALAENADTLLALAPDRDFAHQAAALARFSQAFFAARRDELEARAGAGRVRDGRLAPPLDDGRDRRRQELHHRVPGAADEHDPGARRLSRRRDRSGRPGARATPERRAHSRLIGVSPPTRPRAPTPGARGTTVADAANAAQPEGDGRSHHTGRASAASPTPA
jgi:hypothetical protein